MNSIVLVEIIAAVSGLIGTIFLAFKSRLSGWGFVAFLVSNFAWLAFSWSNGHMWMFCQQIGFTITSLIGIYVWIVKPAIDRNFDPEIFTP